jgi:hypothetical protein
MRAPAAKKKARKASAPQEDEEMPECSADALPDTDVCDGFPNPEDLDFGDLDGHGTEPEEPEEPEAGAFLGWSDDDDDEDRPCAPFAGAQDGHSSVAAQVQPKPSQGWYCALADGYIGRAVATPHWYMHVASEAVHDGIQQAATCGLHAVNHALRPLGLLHTWEDFDSRSKRDERTPSGDWEIAALHRNVEAAGAWMNPLEPAELPALARWNSEQATLSLWSQDTLGCVVHVPGHWVALSRPDLPQTADAAAFLCDSLHRKPYALGAEEVRQLFALIAAHQQNVALQHAGRWSVHVVSRGQL